MGKAICGKTDGGELHRIQGANPAGGARQADAHPLTMRNYSFPEHLRQLQYAAGCREPANQAAPTHHCLTGTLPEDFPEPTSKKRPVFWTGSVERSP